MLWKVITALLVAGGMLLSAASVARATSVAVTSVAGDCVEPQEFELVRLVNAYRKQHGIAPLRMQDNLSASGEHRVQWMAGNNVFTHDGWATTIKNHGYWPNSWLGENIAAGNDTAAETFAQFKNSPGHRALMLSPNYRDIGVGYTYRAGSTYRWWWAIHLGAAQMGSGPQAYGAPANVC